MATGDTLTSSVADALNQMVASARTVRDYDAVVPKTVDRQTLANGTGMSWIEDRIEQMSAQDISETTVLDNPQQYQDTKFSITPTMSGIATFISDRTMRRIDSKVASLMRGAAMQRAMERKKDQDGIAQFAAFTTALAGTGQTMSHGFIAAGVSRILGNTTESGQGAGTINAVLHPFQIKDLRDELVVGIGTYTIPAGLSADMYRKGFEGTVAGANVWSDGNIAINSTPDARGAVYAQDSIVLVQGMAPNAKQRYHEEKGGGGTAYFLYDEYAYGQRRDAWGFSILTDATVPAN